MDVEKERTLIDSLRQLALWIKKEIDDGLSKGTIEPEDRLYDRVKVDKFEYTEQGVSKLSASGGYIYKKDWFLAAIRVEELIRDSREYASVMNALGGVLADKNRQTSAIQRFTLKLAYEYLGGTSLTEPYVEDVIANLLKDIKGEPVRCGADVELDGIVVLADDISFEIGGTNVVLRKTRISDIEKEIPIYAITTRQFIGGFSAILDIEFLGRSANDIQSKVNHAIALLRLFRVGSLKCVTCRMRSESVTEIMGTLTPSIDKEQSLEKSVVRDGDISKLKQFWEGLAEVLPPGFYEIKDAKLDHVVIAYRRYCDALLQNGAIERRIANAVMGLESLLVGGEDREVSYSLRMRVAKLLGLLGFDPLEVRSVMRDVYGVRSTFVHGSFLSDKKKEKLTDKFGDLRSFLLSLLNYLRISIIMLVLIQMSKGEFIELIDSAMVNKDDDAELSNAIKPVKEFVELKAE